MSFFVNTLFDDPFTYLAWVGVVMFSICLHEFSHAHVAYKMGDDTAYLTGHHSLNPMVQMGPASLIMLFLFGIAWGAVPVSLARLRDARARATVAFAGPASNLLLSLVFGFMLALGTAIGAGIHILRFAQIGCFANAVLFFFNLLPVPLLDGWSVFSLFIPALRSLHPARAQQISWIFIALVFLTPLAGLIWGGGAWLSGLIVGAWARFFAFIF